MDEAERSLLMHTWFPVCREEDLHEEGVLEARILDRELVVYASAGTVTVAQGRCPHRGMALWKGAVSEGALQCPYHGWRFAPGSGRCSEIPALEANELPAHVGLVVFPSRTAYGHVWACLAEPALPSPSLGELDTQGWHVAVGEPLEINCGLRQITENFRDIAHLPFVHGATMGSNVEAKVPRYKVNKSPLSVEWSRSIARGGVDMPAKTLTYSVWLPSTASIRTGVVGLGERLLVQFATPLSEASDKVKVYWLVAVNDEFMRRANVDLKALREHERLIFEEDVEIVESCMPLELPLDPHAQTHTRADRFSVAYRSAYQELVNACRENSAQGRTALPVDKAIGAVKVESQD